MAVQNIAINSGDIAPLPSVPKSSVLEKLTQLFWSIIEWLGLSTPKALVVLPKLDIQVPNDPALKEQKISPPPPSDITEVPAIPKKPLPIEERVIDADLIMLQWQLNIEHPNYCRNRWILGKDHGPSYVPRIDGSIEDFTLRSEMGAYRYRLALEDVTHRYLDSF